jgi:rod shape-determining protein MreC
LLSLALITLAYRETSSGGPVHSVQNVGATVLRPFEIATDRIARPFRDVYNWFDGLVTARSENHALKSEVQDLRQKYTAAESALNENATLRRLLQYESGPSFPSAYQTVNTSVIGRAPTDLQQQIVISAGSDHGIRKNDPVVTADGLLGKVTTVFSSVSNVTLLTDATSSVPAVDLTTGAYGLVQHGAGGGTQLIFGRVPKTEIVKIGDYVITAGTRVGALPDIYPHGIQIGKVTSVAQNDVDSFMQIQIEPFADFSSLDSVAVLVRKGR